MSTRRPSADDFDQEIASHLAIEIERLIDEGLTPEAARVEARRRFGNVTIVRERFYESCRWLSWDRLRTDVRDAARNCRKYPVSCIVAVLSLAAGIGATTASLAIRDAVFRRPPPLYRAPGNLSRVQIGTLEQPIMPTGNAVPGPLFAQWYEAPLGIGLAGAGPSRLRDVRANDRTVSLSVQRVSPDLFPVLGVEPSVGRITTDQPAPAVLSFGTWQTLCDGRPDVVGQTIWIDDLPFTVTAVMPERFWFSTMTVSIWLPVSLDVLSHSDVETVVRRSPGTSVEALAERLQTGLAGYAAGRSAGERALRLKVSGVEGTPLARQLSIALPWVLGAAVFLTCLIACANVAILVMAQWTAREREIAMRIALGAGRGRVIRGLLTESMLLAFVGGVLGVAVTFSLRSFVVSHAGPTLRLFDLSIDPRVLLDSFGVTLMSGVLAGVGPALVETRRLHGNPMRTLGSSDRDRQRWRNAFVISEVAITISLLVLAGGLLSTYVRQLSKDLGFDSHRLIAVRASADQPIPVARIVGAVAATPGVAAVAPSTSVPYAGSGYLEFVTVAASGASRVRADIASIGSGFFATLGVPLRAGRAFVASDSAATRTAIVNEELATRLFGSQSPIGRQVWLRETSYEIVGLVAQYSNQALQNHVRDPKLYLPFDDASNPLELDLLVRASGDPGPLVNGLRLELKRTAPQVAVNVYPLDQMAAAGARSILASTALVVPLIAIGMFLTTAGIYGVLAFAIARRAKELALRMALGATRRHILGWVTGQSARLMIIGAVCGIGVTFGLSRIVRASGGEGSFLDPAWPAFVIPVAIVLLAGAGATLAPVRRALCVDPARALRGD